MPGQAGVELEVRPHGSRVGLEVGLPAKQVVDLHKLMFQPAPSLPRPYGCRSPAPTVVSRFGY